MGNNIKDFFDFEIDADAKVRLLDVDKYNMLCLSGTVDSLKASRTKPTPHI